MTNDNPPGRNLGNYYAGLGEKEDKCFLQEGEKIMLSKKFLSSEELNILSKRRELPRHIQGNKIVGRSFASPFLTVRFLQPVFSDIYKPRLFSKTLSFFAK